MAVSRLAIRKAVKKQLRGRIALIGPTGSGKTMTALKVAKEMLIAMGKPNGRVGLIDSENKSSERYAHTEKCTSGCIDPSHFDFEILPMPDYAPDTYTAAIKMFGAEGVDITIVDSLSHAWSGKGGALELVDKKANGGNGNKFTAWGTVTPMQQNMVEAILISPTHVIVTMRSHMEYVQDKDDKGKTVIRKVGMQPVQRAGIEYEFDVICDMDNDHVMSIGKTRCNDLDGKTFSRPGKEFAEILVQWLVAGEAEVETPKQPVPASTVLPNVAHAPFGENEFDGKPKGIGRVMMAYNALRDLATEEECAKVPETYFVDRNGGVYEWPAILAGTSALFADKFAAVVVPKIEARVKELVDAFSPRLETGDIAEDPIPA